MGKRHKRYFATNIITNKAPGPYIILLIIVMLVMGSTGYISVTAFLNKQNEVEVEAEAETLDANSDLESETLKSQTAALGEISVFTVQVSSLTDEASAESAIGIFSDEGITVNYYESDGIYKIVAGLSLNSDYSKDMVKKLVENHPKYKDAFTNDTTISFGTITFDESKITSETIGNDLNQILVDMDQAVYTGYIDNENSYKNFEKISEALDVFSENLINDDDFSTSITLFNEQLKQLISRKANTEAFNKLWMSFLLGH